LSCDTLVVFGDGRPPFCHLDFIAAGIGGRILRAYFQTVRPARLCDPDERLLPLSACDRVHLGETLSIRRKQANDHVDAELGDNSPQELAGFEPNGV
jgi:hypothetical protein